MVGAPEFPDFPVEEFNNRYERARQMMREEGIDALLVTEEINYTYFTGHRSQQNPIDKIRPYVFLLPLDGDPVCFVMPFEEGHIRLTTWIQEVRTYDLLKHNDVIANEIRNQGLANGRIGCELGREQYLGLNFNDFMDLRAQLPEASFVDAADILLRLRMIKTPAEIERCREAAVIVAGALDQAFEAVKPGMTNLEVAQLVRRAIADRGGEKPTFLCVASGYDFTRGKITVPTPRRLEVGDTLTVDTGTELRGYASDVCRTAVIGRASQEQRDMYKFVVDLNRTCYETFKPGNKCEDVVQTCLTELDRVGRTTQAVGRIGHGVGCETTEYPSLAMGEKVAFEPGMVFACNPNFVTEYGFFNVEEELLVTENGYEFLSDPRASLELPVLGAT